MKVSAEITKINTDKVVKEIKSTGTSAIHKAQNFVGAVLPPQMEVYNYIRSNGSATITIKGYKINFQKL